MRLKITNIKQTKNRKQRICFCLSTTPEHRAYLGGGYIFIDIPLEKKKQKQNFSSPTHINYKYLLG